jgi:hypothetical protein
LLAALKIVDDDGFLLEWTKRGSIFGKKTSALIPDDI